VHASSRLSLLLSLACATGCAVTNRANRPLTNSLDRAIDPRSTAAKVAIAPVAIPVGFASIVTDGVVIQPIRSIPRAYNSTANVVWRNPRGGYLRQAFLFLPKVVLTPPFFVGDVARRTLFDVRS